MIARHLIPRADQGAARYPIREVTEEREVADWTDAIEEIRPLPGSWMIIEAEDRSFHFAGDSTVNGGRWDFKSMVVHADTERNAS